jgi:hypothetical protein
MRFTQLFVTAIFCAASAYSQPARLVNSQLKTQAAGSDFEKAFRAAGWQQSGPVWNAWAAPIVPGDRNMCCWYSDGSVTINGCGLEGKPAQAAAGGTVALEGPTEMYIFVRIENGQPGKLRVLTPDCSVDAGGLPVTWFTGVSAADSVKLLASLVRPSSTLKEDQRVGEQAMQAIALHRDESADTALEQFASPSQSEWIRRKAILALGQNRGRRGFEALKAMLKQDNSDRIREDLLLALSRSKEADAIPLLLDIAKNDKKPNIRSKAIFWLAERAGSQVSRESILRAVNDDPDTDVKKQAVFALTRMPNGEGIPALIDVAKTNRNPAVRKQAVFWLGQSKDPRALDFIEQILTR